MTVACIPLSLESCSIDHHPLQLKNVSCRQVHLSAGGRLSMLEFELLHDTSTDASSMHCLPVAVSVGQACKPTIKSQ